MLTRERLKQIEQRQSSLWFSADHRELIATVSELLDLVEEVERLRPKNRVYPCGCVTCICEDEIKCHGCGAVGCGQPGMPAEHTPGAQPMSIPKLRAEVERLTKRCEDARYIIASDVLAPQDLKHSWLEGRP